MMKYVMIPACAFLLTAAAVPAVGQLGDFLGGGGMGGELGGANANAAAAKVEASAVIDTTAISPGRAFTLAITLKMNPGWHVYWSNPGESGIGTSFALTLPAGFTAEKVQFPLPEAHVMPGDVTVYGHEGAATFLVKITPPGELPATLSPLKVKATWLNCTKEQCVPGEATLEVPLKAGAAGEAHGELFAKARAAMPEARAPAGLLKGPIEAKATVANRRVTYTVPVAFAQKPSKVEAFLGMVEGLDVSGVKIEQSEGMATISLTARLLAGQHVKVDTLPLLVVYTGADGGRRGFYQPLSLAPLQTPGTQ